MQIPYAKQRVFQLVSNAERLYRQFCLLNEM